MSLKNVSKKRGFVFLAVIGFVTLGSKVKFAAGSAAFIVARYLSAHDFNYPKNSFFKLKNEQCFFRPN